MRQHLIAVIVMLGLFASAAGADDVELSEKSKVHVYLLIGQSNMAGRGKMTDADKQPATRIVSLNKENEWVAAKHPIHFDKTIAGVGLGMTFAEVMRDHEKGITIALVPCAVGGSPLSRWQKDGDLHKTTLRRIRIAMKLGELKGILWHQGESDSGKAGRADTYAVRLDAMIATWREELGIPNVPFVTGGMVQRFVAGRSAHAKTVQKALEQLPNRVKNTAFVSSKGLPDRGDKLHFSAEGLRSFGKLYATAMITLQEPNGGAYKINREGKDTCDFYEFSSSRLTNEHTHSLMKHALFGYNKTPSFGLVEFNTVIADPTVTYTIIDIDGKKHHTITVKRSELMPRENAAAEPRKAE